MASIQRRGKYSRVRPVQTKSFDTRSRSEVCARHATTRSARGPIFRRPWSEPIQVNVYSDYCSGAGLPIVTYEMLQNPLISLASSKLTSIS